MWHVHFVICRNKDMMMMMTTFSCRLYGYNVKVPDADASLVFTELESTVVLLSCCREMKCSMDSLKFVCSWSGSVSAARISVKIGKLQLEGCSFDGSRLSENMRDSPSISEIPPCVVAWIPKVTYSGCQKTRVTCIVAFNSVCWFLGFMT